MKNFWKILYHITGEIYIPDEALDSSIKILHISDTPSMIYNNIVKLVKRIQPHLLIHTGDVVDDVKLEMLPQHLLKYKARSNEFLNAITPFVKNRVIVVPGNHDNMDVLGSIHNIEILKEGSILNTYGLRIGLAHKYCHLPKDSCDYYLYGHCKTETDNPSHLNGIDRISILKADKREVIKLFYPTGTDDYRLRRNKIGI